MCQNGGVAVALEDGDVELDDRFRVDLQTNGRRQRFFDAFAVADMERILISTL